MKAMFVDLGTDDKKGKDFLRNSLFVCAHDHILSRKLLNRVSTAGGPMTAIVPHGVDLTQLEDYSRGAIAPDDSSPFDLSDRPVAQLVAFVQNYLRANGSRIVICENWAWERKHIAMQPWPPSRLACYGDAEVFHIVTPDITDPKMVESAVTVRHYWQTGVCSACARVPEDNISDEGYFDEIVRNTKHIFIPAFDGDGYLIWSPQAQDR
jgi:hypothetical protein